MNTDEKHRTTAMRLKKARLYAILDRELVAPENAREVCRALLEGGADLVQLRAKQLTRQQRKEQMEELYPLFEHFPWRLIVNDDVELAAAYPGVGAHVGQQDTSVTRAREMLGDGRILGLSTHDAEEVRAAVQQQHLLDYFATGPLFPTDVKSHYQVAGLSLIETARAEKPSIPFFCIGGITRENIPSVLSSGGTRVAVISDILKSHSVSKATREIAQLLADRRLDV